MRAGNETAFELNERNVVSDADPVDRGIIEAAGDRDVPVGYGLRPPDP